MIFRRVACKCTPRFTDARRAGMRRRAGAGAYSCCLLQF